MKIKTGLAILAVFLISFIFYQSTFFVKSGDIYMDSKLYSDFAAHIPLIRSFSHNWNWPPEYPFFAGAEIRYHYLFYLLIGLFERIGLSLPMATNLLSAMGMSLLLMMIYLSGKLIFKSKAVGALAVYLFLFNGSLTFIDYFTQAGLSFSSLLAIPMLEKFVNFGPWNGDVISAFWNLNIYTNQRHLALSFGMVLLLFWPLLKTTIEHKKHNKAFTFWQLLGFALIPLLHQAGALILAMLVFCWLAYYRSQYSGQTKIWYLFLLGVLSSSILINVSQSDTTLPIVWGYLATDKSLSGIVYYWWHNLGLYLLLVPLLIGWSRKRMGILPVIGVLIFLLANTFRFSADLINNHKLINFSQIIFDLMVAGWLVFNWKKNWLLKPAVVVTIIALSFSGWVDLFPIFNDYSGEIRDWSKEPIGAWIEAHTPPRSQFLTGSYMYNPASLVGRALFLDYGYHAWSMGYKDANKRQALNLLYSANISQEEWCQVAKKFTLTHVLLNDGENAIEDGRILLQSSRLANEFTTSYEVDDWRLWSVNDLCP